MLTIRQIAVYAADQLVSGVQPQAVAQHVAATLLASNHASEIHRFDHALETELGRRGITQVTITSALELSDATKKRLAGALGATHPVFNEIVDASVLGGVRVETSEQVLDLTVQRKLTQFKRAARMSL